MMGLFRYPFRKIPRVLLIFIVVYAVFLLTSCETPKSRTRQRMRAVESGLLKAVVFKGQEPEKMKLEERMEYYSVPGVSVAVIYKNRIDWARAYGIKDAREPELVTAGSLFQAAALSQPVSALAALHFVDKGPLSLDSDVNSYLSSWKLPDNKMTQGRKVFLRDLLSHSAGLMPFEYKGYPPSEPLPSLLQILDGQKPSDSPAARIYALPGSQHAYSELGYVVLQQLLVDLGKRPFPQIMKETVFEPLGMLNSTFEYPLPAALKHSAVTGHLRDGRPIEGKWRVYPEKAAAGLWTTPTDVALCLIEIIKQLGANHKRSHLLDLFRKC